MKTAEIVTVECEFFEMNSYLLHAVGGGAGEECVVIDAGLPAEAILAEIRRRGWRPAAILLTHGHADHFCGIPEILAKFPGTPVGIGVGDAAMLASARLNLSATIGIPLELPPVDRTFSDGETLSIAGLTFEVRHTPGHTPGHVVYRLCDEHAMEKTAGATTKNVSPMHVFVGDVIFRESVGRTDLPGGSASQLDHSIREKLYTLPGETVLHSGHGSATTVAHEKRFNSFVTE